VRPPQDAELPSVVLVGAAWLWGARLAGGALLALGSGPGTANALAWLGVAGAGWALAPSAAAGNWGRVAGAALLIALPEAIVLLSGRLSNAAVIGLRVPLPSLVRDGVGRVLLAAAPLVVAAVLFHAVPRALTSARRRSPT
jgi:hypothetical protein